MGDVRLVVRDMPGEGDRSVRTASSIGLFRIDHSQSFSSTGTLTERSDEDSIHFVRYYRSSMHACVRLWFSLREDMRRKHDDDYVRGRSALPSQRVISDKYSDLSAALKSSM